MTPTRIVSPVGPSATLDDVDVLAELFLRPSKPADYQAESRALALLAEELAQNPRNVLQRLVELAVDLCRADTAGISLLDGNVFRWEALAGLFAAARNGTMPRHASPCGVVIDRDAIQLMNLPDRCFPALYAEPRVVEVLLLPFRDHGKPIGGVWVVSQRPEHVFDREDARIIGVLARYASAAWLLWKHSEATAEQAYRKDEFLATLSHELRNPLAAITAAASLLKGRVPTEDSAHRVIEVIVRQSDHVTRLVNDLTDIERIARGKLILDKQPVDLRTVVAQAAEARRPQIERRHQRLTLELGDQPTIVTTDPVRAAQIVSNLVDNATKYTPDSGRIRVAVSSTDIDVLVSVTDDGEGIPPDRLQTIFEPFTQLDSRDRKSGGLGLGLALVRRLAWLLGGAVYVTSGGLGQGSCFTVRLPVAHRTEQPARPSTSWRRRRTSESRRANGPPRA